VERRVPQARYLSRPLECFLSLFAPDGGRELILRAILNPVMFGIGIRTGTSATRFGCPPTR